MRSVALICFLLLLLKSCGGAVEQKPEIMGVPLGINREQAHERLQKLGQLEKQESKQQEVWKLTNDSPYSHLIVAYNKEYTSLRFITAVANEDRRRVRYSDVIDTNKARRTGAGNSVTYTLEVQSRGNQPGYTVKTIGSDPQYLKYYSIEKID